MAADRAARLAMAWGVIVALLRLADTLLNRDHRLRASLAEAVFPAYIIHHPVLVVLAWAAPAAPAWHGSAIPSAATGRKAAQTAALRANGSSRD